MVNLNKKVLWITRTAVLIALLIVMQALTASFNNKLITGSIVNLILVISVMTCGMATGLSVSLLSPIFAKFLSIGPFWTLIPFIMIANCVYVTIWYVIGNQNFKSRKLSYILALVVAALAKFLSLFYGIVKFAVPIVLNLPENLAANISSTFSVPQLITALIGGILAIIMLPMLKHVTK